MEFTEEQQAAIDKQIQDAVNSATKGLVSKKEELERKVFKKNQEIADAETAKKAEIEAAEQAKLEESGELNKLIDRLRTQIADMTADHETKVKALAEDKTKLDLSLRELIVDNELTKQFMAAGVDDPDLLEAAVAIHQGKVEVVEEDGKMVAKIGDGSIEDHVSTWKEGKGKAFISNPNSGGGGKDKSSGGTDDYEIFFQDGTRNLTKQNELRLSDEVRYKILFDKYNKEDNRLSINQ